MNENTMVRGSSHPLMDMDKMKVSRKSIKRYCLNDPDEQMCFDEIYNDENVSLMIMDNYHDQAGNYYLVCNIQELCVEDEKDDGEEHGK